MREIILDRPPDAGVVMVKVSIDGEPVLEKYSFSTDISDDEILQAVDADLTEKGYPA